MESVNCPISEHAKHSPHRCALLSQKRMWTYQELDLTIGSLCNFLEKKGIRENQRIAFIAQSIPATIFLFFALCRLKAIACPVSFRIPKELLSEQFALFKPTHILEPEQLPITSTIDPILAHSIDLDQLATFLFTSGSSATPKIACHSYGNHYYNAMGVIAPLQLDASSRWLLSLPLFHVSGISILFRCFLSGAAIVLADPMDLKAISELKVTHLSFVPIQLYRLLNEPPEVLKKFKHSLRCILLGGAPLPTALLEAAHPLSLPILTTYGMTEMSSIITLCPQEASRQDLAYRSVKIEKDQEIWVSGNTLFKGYWDPAHETVTKAVQRGWFATKDLGRWANDNHLVVIGRKDRQFISGGENIQPEVIERALCSLPGISQAAVLPIEDAEFGARPVAFIEDASHRYSLDSIREKLKRHLPGFMHPIHIFPYPLEPGIKPSLLFLKRHLAQILKCPVKNQE